LVLEPIAERFELIETFEKVSQQWRYLVTCRECGQLYGIKFREEIDWLDGDDPSYTTYIPVASAADAARMSGLSSVQLLAYHPVDRTTVRRA
jgi:hypothetical protein